MFHQAILFIHSTALNFIKNLYLLHGFYCTVSLLYSIMSYVIVLFLLHCAVPCRIVLLWNEIYCAIVMQMFVLLSIALHFIVFVLYFVSIQVYVFLFIVIFCITLHCNALHSFALHYIALCCIPLCCIILLCFLLYWIILRCFVLPRTVLYCISLKIREVIRVLE